MRLIVFFFFTILLTGCQETDNTQKDQSTYIDNPFLSSIDKKVPDSVIKKGRDIFLTACKSCHNDSVTNSAPGLDALNTLTPLAIFTALKTGKMQVQGEKLNDDERKAVAQWITNRVFSDTHLPDSSYTALSITDKESTFYNQSGWGGNSEGTGFRSTEQSGITSLNVGSLQLKWAFAFPDATQVRSKPAIFGDWLITGSEFGDIYAIHIQTGKIGWKFVADAPIRGAISVVQQSNEITACFADYSTNVYSVDVKTGKLRWKKRAGDHPLSSVTGSVTLHDDKIFVPLSSTEVIAAINPEYACCTASGQVVALDIKNGNIIWRHRVVPQKAIVSEKKRNGKSFYGPSGAPVWCSPTVDIKRGLLYIGTGENYSPPATQGSDAIQALDMKTGKLVWNFQATRNDTWNLACLGDDPNCPEKEGPDLDFGMAPLLVKENNGKDILLAGQKSGIVYALSPDNGTILWKTRVGKGGQAGGIHWGMATDGTNVYVANADNIRDLDIRDTSIKASPGIYCLNNQTGKIIWKAATPPCDSRKGCYQSNSAAPTVIPGGVFAGALDGHIRAYSSMDGKILWDFDTVREFNTVNGVKGKGGAIDASGPVVAKGILFVNSGYGLFGQIPGNVLLAFEIR